MSYYFSSVPKNIALMMKDRYSLDTFIETGTYIGTTTDWAANHFKRVHTIENFEAYYRVAELKLINYPNVFMHLSDSRMILPSILEMVKDDRVLFYLDAHWSKSAHYGRPEMDSSALEEILIINEWDNRAHVILVDDAHRFGTERWPTKIAMIDALENNGQRTVRELLDVLVAVPKRRHNESIDVAIPSLHAGGGIRN